MVLAVPAPPVRAAGSRLTGAIYGSDVTDSVTFLANVPIFVAYQSGAQSIANNTLAALSLDATVIDSYGGHSNTVNNSRYTPTVAGYYLVIGSYGQAANGAGNRFVLIYKNGTRVNLGQAGGAAAGAANTGSIQSAALVQCNGSTDYIEVWAFQSSGGALNTDPTMTGMQVTWQHA
jgi:hypothetical protein